jgi:hypothetical protein
MIIIYNLDDSPYGMEYISDIVIFANLVICYSDNDDSALVYKDRFHKEQKYEIPKKDIGKFVENWLSERP